MKRDLWAGFFFLASAVAPAQLASESQRSVLALTNVTVVDTTGSRPGQRATVLITGDRISQIGEPGKLSIPSGAQSIDGTGKYLLPGLWDMHMHLSYVTDLAFPLLIANGVTGVRDMGGDLDEIDRWRDEISHGTKMGPASSGPVRYWMGREPKKESTGSPSPTPPKLARLSSR